MSHSNLDLNIVSQLTNYLNNLTTPVELAVFVDDSAKSAELQGLVNQIAELSSLITVVERNPENERVPSMLVRSVVNSTEIRFAGVPMGHEFTSLVLALLHSGGHPIKLEAEVIEQVKHLQGDFNFETYVSLSCQNCPDVVQVLNMMAAINPRVKNVMIDGAIHVEEAERRNILAVPTVYLNGEPFTQGRVTLSDILNKVDTAGQLEQAEVINDKSVFDFLVVGGGPAGAAAAIYGARKGISTGVVADRFGGQVQDTMAIENFISVTATDGPKLVANLEAHVAEYNVDIMDHQKAKSIMGSNQAGGLIEIELESGATVKSRSVLLATGARWREMNVPGEQEYRGKGVAYCPHCDGPLFKGKSVAVVGGGNSGIEAAIDLAGIVEHVTVLEFDSKLRADAVLQNKANSMPNITIILNAETTEVLGDGDKVRGLDYRCRVSEGIHHVVVAGIFVQIGLVPNTDFLRGVLDLTNRGEIITDERGQTSMPGVFAAGDVTDTPYKQIIIAMGNGANAALGAFDYLIRAPEQVVDEEKAA
ncbi:alkyl hydroperoxide reductase subunit F [Gammaproteobacteria bacterium 45_16_T64]|nr:alkyl hydroperoxide reductase subunit F [Gammaproteobacteria bacterium 45_16_T64]